MSLLNDFCDDYHIMIKSQLPDKEGGTITQWTEGDPVKVTLDNPNQTQKTIAESQRVEVIRNALFPADSSVKLGDYLRNDLNPAKVYRVQSYPQQAPAMSGIKCLKADVIKGRLPE